MTVSRETEIITPIEYIEYFTNTLPENIRSDNQPWCLSGLTFSCSGIILLSLLKRKTNGAVVICDNPLTAERVYRLCYNLLPNTVFYFPETETSFLDVPGFNLENERYQSETINQLDGCLQGLICTTNQGLSAPISNKRALHPGFHLSLGINIERKELIGTLLDWGYDQIDRTTNPKTFSVRGGIIDIFLLYARHPIRIEMFGNRVESLRTFNPMSQRMVSNIEGVTVLPPPRINNDDNRKTTLSHLLSDQTKRYFLKELENFYLLSNDEAFCEPLNLNCSTWNFTGYDTSHREKEIESTLKGYKPEKVMIFLEDKNQIKRLRSNLSIDCTYVKGILEKGFYSVNLGTCLLTYPEIYRGTPTAKYRWSLESFSPQPQRTFTSINELTWGDYLVHQEFGIGIYKGLETIKSENNQQECIKIEYADGGLLYVPVEKFEKVHKLIATGKGTPKLSNLGSLLWQKQKQRVKKSAQIVVQDLINLYTNKNRSRGFRYDRNDELYEALTSSFPYEETPDQTAAIVAVVNDMETDVPVDRLVCGDVGFGKTEVALRAAMKAIASGKKVIFLTPTTILADQHYISTTARLEPLGVRVQLLSRFTARSAQKALLEKMFTGEVDLVIGTHRLLSDDVLFSGLSLFIIDEEHRFGVRHKEKLKQLKSTMDVLTLTATPIPRTLQQSLVGIRDVSKINTPPKMRKPIQTFVKYFDWSLIQRAIQFELERGGQVYFLHNSILSLPFYFERLVELFPQAAISMAHGQMPNKDLERIVLSFFNGDLDILLCTTIVESGLDVTNANTIIINNAHNFGLAQLYQIRGRVGRGYRQAFSYLFIPKGKPLGSDAYQRLRTIEQYTMLGSGYDIALKDLEIRGAGNLFGYKQSGHIATVGFEMYCKLLQEAVKEATGKSNPPVNAPQIIMATKALLDKKYVPLVQDRLYFYQRLSEADTVEQIQDVEAELRDRFGQLSTPARNLIKIALLRIKLTNTSITSLQISSSSLTVSLNNSKPFSSFEAMLATISEKLQGFDLPYRFIPDKKDTFKIEFSVPSLQSSLQISNIFVKLFSV